MRLASPCGGRGEGSAGSRVAQATRPARVRRERLTHTGALLAAQNNRGPRHARRPWLRTAAYRVARAYVTALGQHLSVPSHGAPATRARRKP
jgi:hypothetical protein